MTTLSESAPRATKPSEHDPFAGPAIAAAAPTTDPQREIWTAAIVGEEASLAYNESVTLWMRGPLDVDALRHAIGQVAFRHESLRATFSGDGLTMLVAAEVTVPFELVDRSSWSDAEREADWQALLEREVTSPFDLTRGPLFRVTVFRAGATEHRVVFTAHHIVCDGWSTAVVVREWATLYSANVERRDADLGPAVAFGAYAREQVDLAARGSGASSDEAFWLARFADHVPVLDLPTDRPRPPLKTYASGRVDAILDESLVRALKKVGTSERASLFATLLAGFEAFVARISGQDDVVVGIPSAGQMMGDHAALVGHCVNMLPIRSRPAAERSFRELLAETRTLILDAQEHQQYTFGKLLQRLPLKRDPSRLPLVSVAFNLDRGLSGDALAFAGLRTELTSNPRRFENFDLFLNAVELPDRVALECQYNSDLIDADTARRWLDLYERLLRSITENPADRVGWLNLLPDQEIARLDAWNAASEMALPEPRARVHELIEAQVARSPEALAVDAEDAALTYAQLDERAEALACVLRQAGVRRGALVGLCVERSSALIVGLLGVLKAGGAYVPLDPQYPAERLAHMVRDSDMRVLVTEGKVRSDLPLDVPTVVLLDDVPSTGERAARDEDATPEDPAYVIYTSGSTGVPKGVVVPHRAVVNLLESVRTEPGMAASDVVLAVTTLSFDIAVSEVILPLVVGARIVLASRDVASDGQRLLSLMRSSRATFLDATPATWRLLLAAGWDGGEGIKAICTGERMPPDLAHELMERCSSVWNGYGPTETTVWSTFWQVRPPVQRVLIGKAVANTRLYVLDPRKQRVPIGVVGELYIGGEGVTLGYHARPELTRERFLPDPFVFAKAAPMYKTGDLVRILPSGELECLGRNDSQVKLRGYRIELGEIESALGFHPGVAQAAVIVREDRPGDLRLAAYVVPAQEGPSDADLRAHLKRTLPDYMIPQVFVRLDTMPVLPNGKVDRRRLPEPVATRAAAQDDFVAPSTPSEILVAKIWEEVLAVGRIGTHDDFFALGGHSLLASQFIARLKRDHGIEVSFRRMFEAPTVAKLAAAIDAAASREPAVSAPLIASGEGDIAPLSLAQRRMWLLEEMDPGQRAVHNLVASWRLEGPLNVATLQRALDEIVRRHATLRTNLRLVDGEPVAVVDHGRTIVMRALDLTALPEVDREDALTTERQATMSAPFRLDADPLLRVLLFKLRPDHHVLTTVQHNIVWDGWSFDIFLRELVALYSAFARDAAAPLPLLPIAYADFASWQREWLSSAECAAQSAFWRGRLKNVGLPLQLPTDRPRQGTRTLSGDSVGVHLATDRAAALTDLGRRHGATLFMVVFAAFQVVLHRRTGQRELLVGTPMRARTQPELEGIIGLFVNTVALVTTVDPLLTFIDLLKQVRETTLDAFTNQDVPLDTIGIRPPMMRAVFSLQDATARPLQMDDVTITQQHVVAPVAATELMLWVMESKSSFLLMLNFANDLFDASTARRWLRELDTVLEEVQRVPEQPIGAISPFPPEELELIERAGGSTGGALSETVPGLLLGVASARPDAVAIERGDRLVTFAQLAGRVGAAASELSAKGVGSASHVTVCLTDPEDAVVASLAAMAVGASLVFGDPRPGSFVINIALTGGTDGAFDWAAAPASASSVAYVSCGTSIRQGAMARVLRSAAAESLDEATVVRLLTPVTDATTLGSWLMPLTAGVRVVVAQSPEELRTALASAAGGAPPNQPTVLVEAGGPHLPEGISPPHVVVYGRPSALRAQRLTKDVARVTIVEVSAALGLPISVHGPESPSGGSVHLGRPLRETRWRVIDAQGQLAPVGVSGGLAIDFGDGPVPTGDRVRLLEVGSFEYLGRVDGLLPARNVLVDPRAIAKALEGHPSVREAWATVCEDLTGEPRVVAYCAARESGSWTETELRARVRSALGGDFVPRVFVEVDELPRDLAGSVDSERLPSPYAASRAGDYLPPQSEAERYLAGIWQEALGVARIGKLDNFFELGGHSLVCFRVIARVERDRGVRLSPRLLLLNTLEQVAGQLAGPEAPPRRASSAPASRPSQPPAETRIGGVRSWLKRVVGR